MPIFRRDRYAFCRFTRQKAFFVFFGGHMSGRKYSKEDCIILLKTKYEQLTATGISRYPQRSDFSENEVVAIKAYLGPWPRALETAGIKPYREKQVK